MTPPTTPVTQTSAPARATSPATTINRSTHIHHSKEDLLKKQLMTRLICHRVGGCMQRCMGSDALNALFSVTYDCDQACGTEYHERLNKYIEYCQENDLICNCAQTDVKGSRNPKYKRAHMQPDPDQFFHVVETDVDGIGIDGKPYQGHHCPRRQDLQLLRPLCGRDHRSAPPSS